MQRPLRVSVAGVLAFGLSAGNVIAQANPDFSGRWVLVGSTGSSAGSPLGQQGTIEQDSTTVVFTETVPVAVVVAGLPQPVTQRTLAYRLDGSESRNALRTAAGETWTLLSRVNSATNALVIVTTVSGGRIGEFATRVPCALDTSDRLVIEVVQPGTNRDGTNTTLTSTLTYRKQ